MNVDVTEEERNLNLQMLENSNVPIKLAEQALSLLRKFREAKE